MNKIACISGDVHQYIGDRNPNIRMWMKKEHVCAKEYCDILKSLGVHGTLFVTGKCVDTYPDVFKDISGVNGIELGGHTYYAFRPFPSVALLGVVRIGNRSCHLVSLHHYILYLLFKSFYGPRLLQKWDIQRTMTAFRKIGVNIRSWRTHCYSGNATTFSILDEFGFIAVSDRRGDEFQIKRETGNLYQINVTGPPDGCIRPKNHEMVSNNLKYKRDFWEFLQMQIKEEKSVVLQLHPVCQKMLDNFENFKKAVLALRNAGYEFLTLSEMATRYREESK